MGKGLLIGIDGGGTHSTAVAAWPDGRIAAVAYGEGMNFHNVGVDVVRARLEALAAQLQARCGADADQVCAGLSALDAPADAATCALFSGALEARQLDLQSDAYIALMGFTLGAPGVIVICGTGSMLLRVDSEGRQTASGGWGYLLGDAGSSYTLAREGLMAAIDHAEGLGGPTALTRDALEFFRIDTLRGLIDRVYDPAFTPEKLAGFARRVLERAQEGDAPARALVTRNMQRLAAQAAQMIRQAPESLRVGLYGGVFAHSPLARSVFERTLKEQIPQAQVCDPVYPPELGAVIHLLKRRGLLSGAALSLMKSSYEELCHERH